MSKPQPGCFNHRHVQDPPDLEDLKIQGELDDATVRALVESYVLATSAQLPESRLHPTHPAVGCSEFNRADPDEDVLNRRVSLVVHPSLPVHHDAAPCVEGDAQACPIDSRDAHASCLWYREHVLDPAPSATVHRHCGPKRRRRP